jgi:chaperone modulatory protein CbpM
MQSKAPDWAWLDTAGNVDQAASREAARLRQHFHLDERTTQLLFGYLHRIAQLEHEMRLLQKHLAHPPMLPREGPTPWREPHS